MAVAAIVVEDGTGLTGASPQPNSFATTAQLVQAAENQGLTEIAEADDEQHRIALLKAVRYLEDAYRLRWKGARIEAFQPLSWPRKGVDVPDFFDPFLRQVNVPPGFEDVLFIAPNIVPSEVVVAQIDLALATFDGDTASGVLQGNLGRVTKREKLDTLEVEYFSADDGSTRQTEFYWSTYHYIEPFLLPGKLNQGRLIRS
jgi:hypothetical protein